MLSHNFNGLLLPLLILSWEPATSGLSAGDCVVTGYDTHHTDQVHILFLATIPANTAVFVTDYGVDENGSFATGNRNDGARLYTSDEEAIAGTMLTLANFSNIISGDLLLSFFGDQVSVFTGSLFDPNFMCALNFPVDWQGSAGSSRESALPPGLTNGVTAVVLPFTDAAYVGSLRGTVEEVRRSVNDPSSWTNISSAEQLGGAEDAIFLTTAPTSTTSTSTATERITEFTSTTASTRTTAMGVTSTVTEYSSTVPTYSSTTTARATTSTPQTSLGATSETRTAAVSVSQVSSSTTTSWQTAAQGSSGTTTTTTTTNWQTTAEVSSSMTAPWQTTAATVASASRSSQMVTSAATTTALPTLASVGIQSTNAVGGTTEPSRVITVSASSQSVATTLASSSLRGVTSLGMDHATTRSTPATTTPHVGVVSVTTAGHSSEGETVAASTTGSWFEVTAVMRSSSTASALFTAILTSRSTNESQYVGGTLGGGISTSSAPTANAALALVAEEDSEPPVLVFLLLAGALLVCCVVVCVLIFCCWRGRDPGNNPYFAQSGGEDLAASSALAVAATKERAQDSIAMDVHDDGCMTLPSPRVVANEFPPAYALGEKVEYYSRELQRWIEAVIQASDEPILEDDLTNEPEVTFTIKPTSTEDVQRDVPLSLLRLPFKDGALVEAFTAGEADDSRCALGDQVAADDNAKGKSWLPGVVFSERPSEGDKPEYSVKLFGARKLVPVPVDCLRYRYVSGQTVAHYAGRREGWVSVEVDRVEGKASDAPDVEARPNLGQGPLSAVWVYVRTIGDNEGGARRVPSHHLRPAESICHM